ncbi:MAG: hypothetical protein KAX44_00795 [Candidatus Brocadiae bacterium]|nr:hypothetical protein [Candidatus Brocadiia bacterium]
MKRFGVVLAVSALAAIGLVSCAEDQSPATVTVKGPTVQTSRAQAGRAMRMMAPARCLMRSPTAGQAASVTARVAARAARVPFGAPSLASRGMQSQMTAGQLAVARIEALAARRDSRVDGVGFLMWIAASDAPAPVRRSAIFAVSRLHERAGEPGKAARVLPRAVLLPDEPRPAHPLGRVDVRPARPEQLPPDIQEAAKRLERRRQELDEFAHQLEQRRDQLDCRQKELDEMARRFHERQETE